jgi:hypothetical protein
LVKCLCGGVFANTMGDAICIILVVGIIVQNIMTTILS